MLRLYGYTHVADEGGFDMSGYPRDPGPVRARRGPARLRRDYGGLGPDKRLAKPWGKGHNPRSK